MKNVQVEQAAFVAWAGPGQLLLDGRVTHQAGTVPPPKKSQLKIAVDALDRGEEVDLLDRDGQVAATIEFAKEGYVGRWY